MTRVRRDTALLALTFASGAFDAIAFLGLGKVFSAFMTGNLVFVGVAAGGAKAPALDRVLPALAAFAAGVYVGVRIVRATRGSSVWPRRVSVALGITALAQAVFLAGWLVTSGAPSQPAGDVLVAISALAFGVQSAAVMSLDVKGIFTTAATATLIMLMSDEAGWSGSVTERRRFAGVLAALVAGAASATGLLLHARLYAPVLPLAASVAAVTVATATGVTGPGVVVPAPASSPSRR